MSRPQTVAIPRARIKRVMKADEEIKQIKPDAVLLVGKATELFVELLVESAFRHSQSEKRKGLMYKVGSARHPRHATRGVCRWKTALRRAPPPTGDTNVINLVTNRIEKSVKRSLE